MYASNFDTLIKKSFLNQSVAVSTAEQGEKIVSFLAEVNKLEQFFIQYLFPCLRFNHGGSKLFC